MKQKGSKLKIFKFYRAGSIASIILAVSLLISGCSTPVSPMESAIIGRDKSEVFKQLRLLGNTQAEKDSAFRNSVNYASYLKASTDSYLDIAQSLLDDGANINAGVYLGMACKNPRVIRFLYENKFNLNTQDAAGKTLAHWAVIMGYTESIQALAKYGANLEIQDNAKVTPLGQAVYIWAGGGRFGEANEAQVTQARESRENGEAAAKTLIKSGANVNGKFTEYDHTALFEAARFNREDIVRYLVSVGADPLILDKDGASVETELAEGKAVAEQKESKRQRKLAEEKGGIFSRDTLMGLVAIAGATATAYADQSSQRNSQANAGLPLAQLHPILASTKTTTAAPSAPSLSKSQPPAVQPSAPTQARTENVRSNAGVTTIPGSNTSATNVANAEKAKTYLCPQRESFTSSIHYLNAKVETFTFEEACARARQQASEFVGRLGRNQTGYGNNMKVKNIEACRKTNHDEEAVVYVNMEEPSSSACGTTSGGMAR
jgi:Ankyrin repeats (many copies)/Ankyrin repeat